MQTISKIQEEVWQTIQTLNRLWTDQNNAGELVNYFHKDMVAITPTNRNRIEGRDACVAAWKAFSDSAKIHYWKVIDPKIQVYDEKFTVVTYYFDMSFDMGGQTIKLGGRDMFSLVNEDGKWLVIANQFSPYP